MCVVYVLSCMSAVGDVVFPLFSSDGVEGRLIVKTFDVLERDRINPVFLAQEKTIFRESFVDRYVFVGSAIIVTDCEYLVFELRILDRHGNVVGRFPISPITVIEYGGTVAVPGFLITVAQVPPFGDPSLSDRVYSIVLFPGSRPLVAKDVVVELSVYLPTVFVSPLDGKVYNVSSSVAFVDFFSLLLFTCSKDKLYYVEGEFVGRVISHALSFISGLGVGDVCRGVRGLLSSYLSR